jgi:hypothetical protein
LVRVVKLDGEFVWEDRLRGWRNATILADGVRRECRLSPFRDDQNLAIDDVGNVRVVECGGIAVLRFGGGRVRVVAGINWVGLVSVLEEVYLRKVRCILAPWLEVKCCYD